jgi:hypothetical protein
LCLEISSLAAIDEDNHVLLSGACQITRAWQIIADLNFEAFRIIRPWALAHDALSSLQNRPGTVLASGRRMFTIPASSRAV